MQTDIVWSKPAMRNLRPLFEVLHASGVPLAIIYNADADATTDEDWQASDNTGWRRRAPGSAAAGRPSRLRYAAQWCERCRASPCMAAPSNCGQSGAAEAPSAAERRCDRPWREGSWRRDLRKARQLGEFVVATGADTLGAAELAGALIALAETIDPGEREAWAKRRRSFFLKPGADGRQTPKRSGRTRPWIVDRKGEAGVRG
jgi:hypothetical protein